MPCEESTMPIGIPMTSAYFPSMPCETPTMPIGRPMTSAYLPAVPCKKCLAGAEIVYRMEQFRQSVGMCYFEIFWVLL